MKISVVSFEQMSECISKSHSIADALRNLGMLPRGGNYFSFRNLAKKYNLELSFAKSYRKNIYVRKPDSSKKLPIEEMLVENSTTSRSNLKKRLLEEGLLKNRCSICNLENIWNGKEMILIMDHINGVPNDNRLQNLRMVCPNCNSQLDTFCGRKSKLIKNKCIDCGNPIWRGNIRCFYCAAFLQRKVIRPPISQIKEEMKTMTMLAIGEKYGVSDNAIRKWLKKDREKDLLEYKYERDVESK